MENFLETAQSVITGLLLIVGGASILAKLTPWQEDDKLLAKVKKFLLALSLNQK